MRLVIVDYNMGNTRSIANAFERLGVECELTFEPDSIRSADKVLLPGVGAGKAAMMALERLELQDCIRNLKQPTLGICLGMQIMCDYLEEGDIAGLGLIPGRVERLLNTPKSPQLGWNTITDCGGPLLEGVENDSYVYYANSYGVPVGEYSTSTTHYGSEMSGTLQNENFYGCQFHPEKSGEVGERILKNFLKLER